MNDTDFMLEKQKAIERMKEFYGKSPPDLNNPKGFPSFVKMAGEKKPPEQPEKSNFENPLPFDFKGLNLPFIDNLKTDGDLGLILGLILLLVCENTDKLTLIALLYILL